jgi:hypothetical protein
MNRLLRYPLINISFFVSYYILLIHGSGFFSFDYYKPRFYFWDLNNGLLFWECYKKVGLDVFLTTESSLSILESCRNFNYGYFSLMYFGAIQLITKNIIILGTIQIVVFIYLVVLVYFRDNFLIKNYYLIIALFSPGFFLLFASGNMDILIITLLLLAVILISNGREKGALCVIGFSAICKFYTAPVLLIAILIVKQRKSKFFGFIVLFITGFIITYQFTVTPPSTFGDGAQNKFGVGIFDNYARKLGLRVSSIQGEIFGFLILFLSLFFIFYFFKKFKVGPTYSAAALTSGQIVHRNIFLLMAGASVFSYLFTLNVDYRLVYVALAGLSLMQLPYVKVHYVSRIFPYIWLLSIWICFPFQDLKKYFVVDLQPLGDFTLIGTISYFIFQGYYILKQVINRNRIF